MIYHLEVFLPEFLLPMVDVMSDIEHAVRLKAVQSCAHGVHSMECMMGLELSFKTRLAD